MKINNAPILHALEQSSELALQTLKLPNPRRRNVSEPCLPERLPSIGFLQREAEDLAPKEVLRQLRRTPSPTSPGEVTEESASQPDTQRIRRHSVASVASSSSIKSVFRSFMKDQDSIPSSSGWKTPEPYQILRAIEDKNIMFLMEVRDNEFPLLLRNSGGVTPLVHAMRLGNKDVAIILLGAFSRWVNHLEDNEIRKPQTQTYLKALRTNLKLAIDEGLAKSQSELIASFMQTLIMSEGDKWVWAQVSTIARALNAGTDGEPVKLAGSCVRKFATQKLGKADLIATLEDYIANATGDLLMLSAWSLALQSIPGEKIPSYYFARDDRVYKAFLDRLDRHKVEVQSSCSRRLKWQLRVLRAGLEGRSITYRRKIELLAGELDRGEGM